MTLRPVHDVDLPLFFDHQRDPEAARMADFPARDHAAFHAHWQRIRADPSVLARTILADGQVAGNVVSWEADGARLVGFWLGRGHWGRGVATAALRAALTELPVRPLHAHVARHNQASRRVLEKAGFRPAAASAGPGILVMVLG